MTRPSSREDTLSIKITGYTLVTCLGHGRAAHLDAMIEGRSGLGRCDIADLPFDCFVGCVPDVEGLAFPDDVVEFDNRANRLALAALETDGFRNVVDDAKARYGTARFGVIIGTSTSGIEKLETVYRDRDADAPLPDDYLARHHDDYQAGTAFLQKYLGLTGPSYSISTACSSSAKALVDAVQLVDAGLCDVVLAGGVDSLCLTTLNGFEAMQLVSRRPSRPCDIDRDGLSIGEGAAFVIVERSAGPGVRISGYGESSDGVSMSTPPEDGAGAFAAIKAALDRAGLTSDQINYVNLHGTATPSNDAAECRAVANVFGTSIPVSSFKGAIGHTLGAAGAVETVMCLIAQESGVLPGNVGMESLDPEIVCDAMPESRRGRLEHVMTNAFGFGGSNCVLVLSA
ncbi:MAG TPA: beta-ketoacyl-ACP synthase [Woeseiaceae bacterium]